MTSNAEILSAAGFLIAPMGGGCTAWAKDLPGHNLRLLVTDEVGCSHDIEPGESYLVGIHDTSNPENYHEIDAIQNAATGKDAIKHATALLFAHFIRRDLSAEKLAEAVERNKTYDAPICATHDFLDANMVMAEAFQLATGREVEPSREDDAAMWNQAWAIAKAREFKAESYLLTPAS